jgi:hypothetical protein
MSNRKERVVLLRQLRKAYEKLKRNKFELATAIVLNGLLTDRELALDIADPKITKQLRRIAQKEKRS